MHELWMVITHTGERTIMRMKRLILVVCAAMAIISVVTFAGAAATPACDPDNGGLKLPQGFCAAVVADNLGRARHLAVAPNGDLFVSTQTGRGGSGGGVFSLRDTDGDGKFEDRKSTRLNSSHLGISYAV